MDGRAFSPAVSSAREITPFPAVACARRRTTVGDHGRGRKRSSLNVEPGPGLACWTCSGRARIQWVERNAQSDLDVRAGQAHVLDGQAHQLLLGSSACRSRCGCGRRIGDASSHQVASRGFARWWRHGAFGSQVGLTESRKRFGVALALLEAGESEALIFTKVVRAGRSTSTHSTSVRSAARRYRARRNPRAPCDAACRKGEFRSWHKRRRVRARS